jgi:hypothetical protein
LTLVADGLTSPFTSEIVTIVVGAEPQAKINAHSDIICTASTFFTACLNDSMLETHTKVVNLPKDDPNAFALILNLLYDISPNPTPPIQRRVATMALSLTARQSSKPTFLPASCAWSAKKIWSWMK